MGMESNRHPLASHRLVVGDGAKGGELPRHGRWDCRPPGFGSELMVNARRVRLPSSGSLAVSVTPLAFVRRWVVTDNGVVTRYLGAFAVVRYGWLRRERSGGGLHVLPDALPAVIPSAEPDGDTAPLCRSKAPSPVIILFRGNKSAAIGNGQGSGGVDGHGLQRGEGDIVKPPKSCCYYR